MVQSFFHIEPNKDSKRKQNTCVSCGLYRKVLSPKMEPFGNFKKGILNIGEAPGEEEDKKGRQWQGKVGQRLKSEYAKIGINLFDDCLNFNAVNCRPTDKKGNNRPPSKEELLCCRRKVLNVIKQYKPKIICLFGQKAVESVIGVRMSKNVGKISKWRGFTIPDEEYGAWICPLFHPSYLERQQQAPEIETIWKKDLKQVVRLLDKPLQKPLIDKKNIRFCTINDLDKIDFPSVIAIDYETTGLKPYKKGHQIVCASIAFGNEVVAFMIPEDAEKWAPFLRILRATNIGKIAHNLKFEEIWSREYLHQPVQNWVWDTMIASHIIDNKRDITGLKFQTYINFGVSGYDDSVSGYLTSQDPKNANTQNKVLDLIHTDSGKHKLLEYCALDSLYTLSLAKLQMDMLGKRWPDK